MKNLFFAGLFLSIALNAHAVCNDPLKSKELCFEMMHLRSQVLALGAQRDLMQVNYSYYEAIGNEIATGVIGAIEGFAGANDSHLQALGEIKKVSLEFTENARARNTDTFRLANKIQSQCVACHAGDKSQSGYRWDEIFKKDWSTFYKRCNSEGHNPFYCRNMYGMLSSYSYFNTANNLSRFNFNMTKLAAKEINRISTLMSGMGIFHGGEQFLKKLNDSTAEIVSLADAQNPLAFEKGVEIGNTCMSCHGESRVLSRSGR